MKLIHSTQKKLSPGKFYPLGATPDSSGTNFAIYSQYADAVFLLLFDVDDALPTDTIMIENKTRNIYHVHVGGIKAGQRYGYKVCGRFDPSQGFRFNENKLLIDPYAKALSGKAHNKDNLILSYIPESADRDLSFDIRDSSSIVPKAIVVSDQYDWENDIHPDIPVEKLVIYEVHLKGFTASPSSQTKKPGSYLGFIEKIPYLKDLGINAVELLPCHEYFIEDFITAKGLTNYWGYNTLGFFAPESSYASDKTPGTAVNEFKTLVKELHRAGIECIMDVVYNHTAEGNEMGTTLSLKGIDNKSYYMLTGPQETPGRYYMNHSGCGNTVDLANPAAMRLVLDSLRYWVTQMHVDGFRFDLASVLGREAGSFRSCSSFFDAVSQDPVLSRVKLIAEPWDLSTYQVGNFPIEWMEWNGRYRDVLRKFMKGDSWQIRELGYRLTGSADLYGDDGRSAYASVNFITCHDGFTLNDLVSYNSKHNDANREDNRDGSNDNYSWNCGAEGPTDNEDINRLRMRMAKNHLFSLLLSCGTPMLLGGDEFLRTQNGNNNAYCQDNEISWFDWKQTDKNSTMIDFVKKLISFRSEHPVLQRTRFFTGRDTDLDGVPDLSWFNECGVSIDWNSDLKTICYLLDGSESSGNGREYLLYFVMNADFNEKEILLPNPPESYNWHRIIDTGKDHPEDFITLENIKAITDKKYHAQSRSSMLFITSKR
jgi:glycogen operon protein